MNLLTFYLPQAPFVLTYMLQQVEYGSGRFLAWALRLPNLSNTRQRGKLDLTARGKLTLVVAYISFVFPVVTGLGWILLNHAWQGFILVLLAPVVNVLLLALFNTLFGYFIVRPTQGRQIAAAKAKLSKSTAVRIAVLGSYGKTSMKEILKTVLGTGKKVAATPGNRNQPISHAEWVNQSLTGDEEVLIFEYGEGEPGDIVKLGRLSQPEYAVITGVAPAHLDRYPSLDAIADDFATIQQFAPETKRYVNGESSLLVERVPGIVYGRHGVGDWHVRDASVSFEGTKFTLSNGHTTLELHSQLLGLHQIGPLAAAVVLGLQLGLSPAQVTQGVAQTTAFEHRMQPRALHGAWIIDDTYNGNIEGMRAGLALLKALPGKQKIYVTPGLVDQGAETARVHEELGQLIAQANPDKVVLMENSVTPRILKGLQAGDYKGEIVRETKPLEYYTNLEHFLAAGDVVMLQNDWPDAYR